MTFFMPTVKDLMRVHYDQVNKENFVIFVTHNILRQLELCWITLRIRISGISYDFLNIVLTKYIHLRISIKKT